MPSLTKEQFVEEAMAFQFYGMTMTMICIDGLFHYVYDGIPPGGFLTSIITNDLTRAVAAADDFNLHNIPAYVAFMYQKAPFNCWGSKEAFDEWVKEKEEQRLRR